MLSLPANIQSFVAQTIDGAESKITGCLEGIKDKTEELSVDQLKLYHFIQDGLEGLDKSEFRRAQKLHDLSLDMKNILEALLETHDSFTDAVLERISNGAVKIQDSQRIGFQAVSKSTKESMDIIRRSVLQQEARTQAHSTQIYRQLEHIRIFLESVQRTSAEAPNQAQSPYASEWSITSKVQALFSSLWVIWKTVNGVTRQFMSVTCYT